MEQPLRILIADDHPLFREGVVRTIERNRAYAIAGQASDGAEALEMISTSYPDIAVLDVEMPKMSGIDVARSLHNDAMATVLVFLTMYKDPTYFNAALDLGVRGFVLKDSASSELIQCLDTVAKGEYYISPSISHLLIERRNRQEHLLQHYPAITLLTPAEKAILRHLANNCTSKEIADKLFVSVRTVENHRMHICQKLEIKGHNKLLQFAMEHKAEL